MLRNLDKSKTYLVNILSINQFIIKGSSQILEQSVIHYNPVTKLFVAVGFSVSSDWTSNCIDVCAQTEASANNGALYCIDTYHTATQTLNEDCLVTKYAAPAV